MPRGRPPIPADQRRQRISFRLRPADLLRLQELGGREWLEQKLKESKIPNRTSS